MSNFHIHHLQDVFEIAEIKPMVNQVEYHPRLAQEELHDFCKEHNIQLEAWSPLMQGQLLDNPTLQEIAKNIINQLRKLFYAGIYKTKL